MGISVAKIIRELTKQPDYGTRKAFLITDKVPLSMFCKRFVQNVKNLVEISCIITQYPKNKIQVLYIKHFSRKITLEILKKFQTVRHENFAIEKRRANLVMFEKEVR